GEYFASAGSGFHARIWDFATRQQVSELYSGQEVHDVAFSPDGEQLVAGIKNERTVLWDWKAEEQIGEFTKENGGHTEWGPQRVSFHPDGSGFATGASDYSVRIWEIGQPEAARAIQTNKVAYPNVWGVAYHPAGRYLATGGLNVELALWDSEKDYEKVNSWPVSADTMIRDIAWFADGVHLAVALDDGTVHIHELPEAAERSVLFRLAEERATRKLTRSECELFYIDLDSEMCRN
ncbi:MAG: WD40 repeat domain-containing protein, partial [Candidatus Promineifilaceae bacterium]